MQTSGASRWCSQTHQSSDKADNQHIVKSPTTPACHKYTAKAMYLKQPRRRFPDTQNRQSNKRPTVEHQNKRPLEITPSLSHKSRIKPNRETSTAPQQARLNSGARNTSTQQKGEAPPQPTRQPQRQTGLDHIKSCRRPERHHALRDGAQ